MASAADGDRSSDDAMVAGLRAAPAAAFERLWAAAAVLAASPTHGEWRGGQPLGDDGVLQMPYVELDPSVRAVVEALTGVGAVVPFPWPDWAAGHEPLLRSAAAIADAPTADVVRVVTSFVRGDRFTEGLLLEVADDGRLAAAVEALRRWHRKGVTPPP
jgi:hypothetical protein